MRILTCGYTYVLMCAYVHVFACRLSSVCAHTCEAQSWCHKSFLINLPPNHWGRVSQSNPELAYMDNPDNQFALGIFCCCLPKLELKAGHSYTHSCFWKSKHWSSGLCGPQVLLTTEPSSQPCLSHLLLTSKHASVLVWLVFYRSLVGGLP